MTKANCCVPNCPATSTRHFRLRFYKLPKDKKARKRWTTLIRNAALKESKWTSACNLHFHGGIKTYGNPDPSVFPWTPEWENVVKDFNLQMDEWFDRQSQHDHQYANKPPVLRLSRPTSASKPRQLRDSRNSSGCQRVPEPEEIPIDTNENKEQQTVTETENNVSPVEPAHQNETLNVVCMSKPYYEATFVMTTDELQDLLGHIDGWLEKNGTDIDTAKRLLRIVVRLLRNYKEQYDTVVTLREMDRFDLKHFEGSDEDIRFWTGFYSYDIFKIFWTHYVESNTQAVQYWGSTYSKTSLEADNCGPKRKLAPIDELFLVLVKLKRGSASKDLGERFGVHQAHVSRIFVTWIQVLHKVMSAIDIWISRRQVRKHMPDCFKPMYQDVRVIVDCTEIRSERPSDFEVQCATYSAYKSCNTYKALVGISPSGIPTFVSQLYEGSISDNEITNKSKLRDILEPADAIMADRGWTCANWLAKKGIRLVTPHFLNGKKQMTIPDLVESVSIARVRIHVERCMGRIKQWLFLKQEVPLTYWPMISDIFQVCAKLVIFWPPLLEDETGTMQCQ